MRAILGRGRRLLGWRRLVMARPCHDRWRRGRWHRPSYRQDQIRVSRRLPHRRYRRPRTDAIVGPYLGTRPARQSRLDYRRGRRQEIPALARLAARLGWARLIARRTRAGSSGRCQSADPPRPPFSHVRADRATSAKAMSRCGGDAARAFVASLAHRPPRVPCPYLRINQTRRCRRAA